MKKWWLLSLALSLAFSLQAQEESVNLQQCLDWARANFPLLEKQKLQDEQLDIQLRSIKNTYLPKLYVTGQLTYQSDVPELESQIFQLNIPKGQYRAALNFEQTLYDGGNTTARKAISEAENQSAIQRTEVSWNEMRKMVVNLYFASVVQDQAMAIIQASKEQLDARVQQLEAMEREGSILESEVLKVKAQILELEKQESELESSKTAALKSLSLLTGQDLSGIKDVEVPAVQENLTPNYEQLPEMQLIELQQKQLIASEKLASTNLVPRLSAFGTGGIAQPNPYNFFDTEFGTYYMVGVRLHWNLLDWGDSKRSKSTLSLQRQMLNAEAEQLKQNTQVKLNDKQAEIARLEEAAERDGKIAEMRASIRNTASKQLDEGTITPADFLDTVMDEQRAQLSKELNELRLSKAWVEYLMDSGNYQQ